MYGKIRFEVVAEVAGAIQAAHGPERRLRKKQDAIIKRIVAIADKIEKLRTKHSDSN